MHVLAHVQHVQSSVAKLFSHCIVVRLPYQSLCVCVRAANLCGDFAVILKTLRVPRCAS